jgi:hypothetical protein
MEAGGMRPQSEINRLKAAWHGSSSQDASCRVAGESFVGGRGCTQRGETIDPFKVEGP